jgi:crotonobetainyl-CoA:carnitine CoA-transferase CaiB-like acyl-CoA transferase
MAGPLDGIKVVDISAVISGPMCALMLGDQGADVIKVEPLTGGGDLVRNGGYRRDTISAMFATANRGKRCIALDLAQTAGVEALKAIVKDADVFVQNFRPGAVERMGIGPADLHAINPKLIYVSISGFGPEGPYRDWRVYDPIIQAISGVVSIQQSRDIPIPDLVRTLVCDKATAMTAAQAVTAALFARERGQASGQHLVIPMIDSTLYYLWPDVFMGHTMVGDGVQPGPLLYQVYRLQPTADGHVVYFAATDSEAHGLFRALGLNDMITDPRFATMASRQTPENFALWGEAVDTAFQSMTTDEVLPRLYAEQVPAAPILTVDEVFDDPQVKLNDAIQTWEHPVVGTMRQARPAVRWSHTQHDTRWSVDRLGESSHTVLAEHGYSPDQIAELQAAGVIAPPYD